LGTAEFAYNNKVHTGTKVLPFEANSGQSPRMGFELRKKGRYEGAEKFAERIKEIQREAKTALAKAQNVINCSFHQVLYHYSFPFTKYFIIILFLFFTFLFYL